MTTENLHLKQISCLQSPVNNQAWQEIAKYSPAVLDCLVENRADREPEQPDLPALATSSLREQISRQDLTSDDIPWWSIDESRQDEHVNGSLQLKRFFYDCSYLSPFVRNVYRREQSAKGWYRWVGPDPALNMMIPLSPAESEHWMFTVTFHAFLDESHSNCVSFQVNDRFLPLEWVGDSSYQCRFPAAHLYRDAHPGKSTLASLTISVPEARQASEQDQRIIAFAFRELLLIPA